jgi:predicted nucleic acid-binding protein
MATSTKRVYWDACIWIALIQKEKIPLPSGGIEDREQMCRSVIEAAKKGRLEIATSTLCLAEVCKHLDLRAATPADKIAEFFEHDYILLVNVDRYVGELARELMLHGHSKLKPPDAIHLATAAITQGIEQMHTFDRDLLDLDGVLDKMDGTKLKICKPDPGGPAAPLLEAMKSGGDAQADG